MTVSPDFSSIAAVIFDWDFTLACTLGPGISLNARTAVLFRKFGVACTDVEVAAARAAHRADLAKGRALAPAQPQKKREIIHLYQELLRRLGHPDSSYDFAYEIYAGYGRLPHLLYADVLPTLKRLLVQNLSLGILSNHSSSVRSTIKQHLDGFIPQEHIVISEEVGVHKPRKTIFRRAAAKLHQKPSQCLYVGDNLQVDATAAVVNGGFAAGIWIDRSGQDPPTSLPTGVHRITALAQLILLLKSRASTAA